MKTKSAARIEMEEFERKFVEANPFKPVDPRWCRPGKGRNWKPRRLNVVRALMEAVKKAKP